MGLGRCLDKPDCDRREAERPFRVAVNEHLIDLRTSAIANDVVFIGQTDFAPQNHFFNADRFALLQQLVTWWNASRRPHPRRPNQYLDPLLHLNDASLVWGGKFSVDGSWEEGAHVEHRRGRQVDIRGNFGVGSVPRDREQEFRDRLADLTGLGDEAVLTHGSGANRHHHVRFALD